VGNNSNEGAMILVDGRTGCSRKAAQRR